MDHLSNPYVAGAFELGVFVALALLAALWPSARKWAVVVLGALTPLVLSLAVTSVRHLLLGQEEAGFIFREIWLTTLLPYAGCLVFGAALGLLRVPRGLPARYILGLAPVSVLAVVLAVVWPQ